MSGSRRGLLRWGPLALGLALVGSLCLVVGGVYVPPSDVVAALSGGEPSHPAFGRIVLDYRLPRLLTGLVAGAAIGVAGLLLQTLFRNPLAEPWFFGLVQGARLGVALYVVAAGAFGSQVLSQLGLVSNAGLMLFAGLGAAAVTAALIALAPRVGPVTLLLCGLMLGQACEGLVSAVLHFTVEPQARAFAAWNDATFSNVGLGPWRLLAGVVVAGLAASALLAKPLNGLLLGDDEARTLGLSVERARIAGVGIAAVLSGAVTAFCGPVPFLGILAPHLARAVFASSDHRVLLPASALTGAALALTADLVVHGPWERHFLHLNAMLGLVGAPVVLVLLWRRETARALQ